jgi:hypothetical protein
MYMLIYPKFGVPLFFMVCVFNIDVQSIPVTDPIPYLSLPDEWANQAHCPVCNASPLAVVHRAGAPDQMACPRCSSLFEIEQKGPHIHFTALPEILTGLAGRQWVTYTEVRRSVKAAVAQHSPENQAAASPPPDQAPAPPEPSPFTEEIAEMILSGGQVEKQTGPKPEPRLVPPVQAEPVYMPPAPEIKSVRTRAKDLYALGNRPEQIKQILSRDPILDKAEIQAEVDILSGIDGARKHRQRTILWVSIVIELVVILVCGALISVWRPLVGVLGGDPGKQFVATLSANQTIAPLIGTPVVRRETESSAPHPSCPQTKVQAAALFGGPADSWISDIKDGSWFLVSRTPVNLHVPGGMSVIVVDRSSAGLDAVPGPASIDNVKSVTILCR